MDPKKVAKDGFSVNDARGSIADVALLSLRTALKAYFSTYQSMQYSLHMFEPGGHSDQGTIDSNHATDYIEAATETLLHLQHFVELFSKTVLRSSHPILASSAADDVDVLFKLTKGQPLTPEEERKLKSLEFSAAWKRLIKLVGDGSIDQSTYGFVVAADAWATELGTLRNRLWHRGSFVLRYPALDRFVGQFVLPFVLKVLSLPEYAGREWFWKYRRLHCGYDPLTEIARICASDPFDLTHVALLKELGRAAYENPLTPDGPSDFFDKRFKRRFESAARLEEIEAEVSEVKACPVCGLQTLVVYDESTDPDEDGNGERWLYTWQVECRCCSFTVDNHLKNPGDYGLAAIPDFWKAEKLS